MQIRALIVVTALILSACGDPKNTPLPQDMAKMESIKPAMEKLTVEERELVGGYMVRLTIGAKFGGLFGATKSAGVPDGMTIGKAIDEQRKFQADRLIEEAKQKAVKDKLLAERTLAENGMREAVTVTLVSKNLRTDRGMSGMLLDEKIEVVFGYKNNTAKNITGVKGQISIRDQFGDELSAFQVSNDATIKAGESITWTGGRSLRFSMGSNQDRKLVELADDRYTTQWSPQVIVFADGTKMTLPD
jgi:hypothetical protein